MSWTDQRCSYLFRWSTKSPMTGHVLVAAIRPSWTPGLVLLMIQTFDTPAESKGLVDWPEQWCTQCRCCLDIWRGRRKLGCKVQNLGSHSCGVEAYFIKFVVSLSFYRWTWTLNIRSLSPISIRNVIVEILVHPWPRYLIKDLDDDYMSYASLWNQDLCFVLFCLIFRSVYFIYFFTWLGP